MELIEHHLLKLLLTAAALATFIWLLQFRKRLKMSSAAALIISVLPVLYGVMTVKVFAVFEAFGDLSAAGNMSLFGGVFLMPVAYAIGAKLTKRKIADVFDIFAIAMVFTLMCARINCLFAGCCFGTFIPGTELRWPTRQAELIYYLIFLAITAPKVLKNKTYGEVYPLYMASYGIFRTVCECFRYSSRTTSIFHLSHIWALISFGLGISIYAEIKRKHVNFTRKKRE